MADDIDRASELEGLQRTAAISHHLIDRSAVSATHCTECGEGIEEARRKAYPGCTLCVSCKSEQEDRARHRVRN